MCQVTKSWSPYPTQLNKWMNLLILRGNLLISTSITLFSYILKNALTFGLGLDFCFQNLTEIWFFPPWSSLISLFLLIELLCLDLCLCTCITTLFSTSGPSLIMILTNSLPALLTFGSESLLDAYPWERWCSKLYWRCIFSVSLCTDFDRA